MKRIFAVVLLVLAACGGDDDGAVQPDASLPDAGPVDFTACRGSDESFVRNASLAILGRRPLSEAEVDVYAQLLRGVRAKDHAAGRPDDPDRARRVVARALMQDPDYTERWVQHFMDRLRVIRADDQEMRECYGVTRRGPDDGALARSVVAASPKQRVAGGEFTLRDLLRSAIVLDDVTPAYRAHLFHLVTRAIPAANVSEKEAELARRADFGNTFDAVYLNRDIVCLGCHNSEASTTDRDDPKEDRFWPVPGLFEKAIYGVSTGTDPHKAHAMFRYADFVGGDARPWGWAADCGQFAPTVGDDVLTGVQATFASLRGAHTTAYDTEAALAHGFQVLRRDGLVLAADQTIADADVAFAYLVTLNIVDGVWSETVGSSLVIANYFPRNQAARDVLHGLTEKFVASGFSVRALLEEIVVSPYFDRLPPAAGCGSGPYDMPAVYDPWVRSDDVVERRQNGPGDGVHALSSRTAVRAAYRVLGWAAADSDFPGADGRQPGEGEGTPLPAAPADERAFQSGVGIFLTSAERGFRGMEFQARLEWENRFGRCQPPADGTGAPPGKDYVDGLMERTAAAPDATVRDVVVALKDHVVSEASVVAGAEQAALEAILGAGLDTPAAQVTGLAERVRRVCGVLLSSPQFLLGGQASQAARPVPRLTPADEREGAVCARVAAHPLPGGLHARCAGGALVVE